MSIQLKFIMKKQINFTQNLINVLLSFKQLKKHKKNELYLNFVQKI